MQRHKARVLNTPCFCDFFNVESCFRFDAQTKNYKLFYDGLHYVGEKRFETVEQLVADGLIYFYLESRAADYIASLSDESNYAQSPYLAYSVKKKRLQKSKRHATNHRLDNVDARIPPDAPGTSVVRIHLSFPL